MDEATDVTQRTQLLVYIHYVLLVPVVRTKTALLGVIALDSGTGANIFAAVSSLLDSFQLDRKLRLVHCCAQCR